MSQMDLLKSKNEVTKAIHSILNEDLVKCLQNKIHVDVMMDRIRTVLKNGTTGIPRQSPIHCHQCNAYVPLGLAHTSRAGCDLKILTCPHCHNTLGRLKLMR